MAEDKGILKATWLILQVRSDNSIYLDNMDLYRTFELKPNELLVISYGKRPRLFPHLSEGSVFSSRHNLLSFLASFASQA